MQIDLNSIDSNQQKQRTRYLVGCDRANQGLDTDEFEQGINLSVNMLSSERFLTPVTKIGSNGCIYRIDLDAYTLSNQDWKLVERSTLLDFVSKSTRNQDLQFQTQTLKPYVFAVDFTCLSFECDAVAERQNGGFVYYDLTGQANNTQDFFKQQGINSVQQLIDDEDAIFAGFSQSQIALGKTRLLQLLESDDGFVLSTFDTALGGDDLFQNPFTRELAFAGNGQISNKIFRHDAQEHLFTLNNGLLGFRLNNAADNAEIVAPANVVSNLGNERIDPQIRLSDCANCHFGGMIPFQDAIGEHILKNSAFDQNEKLVSQIFFKGDKITATIDQINRRYKETLDELGINARVDPMTQTVLRPLREEMDATQIAAFTFLDTEEFLTRLAGTAQSSQVFGSLLTGGKVNLAVLNANFKTLVAELNLFQDVEL